MRLQVFHPKLRSRLPLNGSMKTFKAKYRIFNVVVFMGRNSPCPLKLNSRLVLTQKSDKSYSLI